MFVMDKVTPTKNLIIIVYFFVLTFRLVNLKSKDCTYIKDVKVYVNFALFAPFVQLENSYEKTINGCFEDRKFLSSITNRIGINCTEREITQLGESAIRNMLQLQSIDIFDCPIERIEPHIFAQVPKLERIALLYGKLKEIRRGIFDVVITLKQIILRGHEIEYVEDYAFGDLPNIKIIDLSYNHLRYLSTNWFTNSTSLTQLYITHNFIRTIRQGTFQYIPNLQYLWMANNSISVIDAGAFDGLTNLLYLDLGQNQLTTISSNIFPKDLSVGYVNLERNLFNYFPMMFLRRILSDGSIKIVGNPLQCKCLDQIHRWMYEEKVDIRLVVWSYYNIKKCYISNELPVCVTNNDSRFCIESVDTELTKRYVQELENHLPIECP